MSGPNTISRQKHFVSSVPIVASRKAEVRVGRYRLLRVVSGKTAFAEVQIQAVANGKSSKVTISLAEDSVAPAAWKKAAVSGAKAMIRGLSPASHYLIQITLIAGSISDTKSDAVDCATGMAVFEAIGTGSAPKLISRAGKLKLDMPVRV